MKRRVVTGVVIVVFSVFIFSNDAVAKNGRGAELVVQKRDGQRIRGELIAVKQNSILLLDAESAADVSANIEDIRVIVIVKKSKAGKGALFGFLAGSGLGVINALAHKGNQDEDVWMRFFNNIFGLIEAALFISAGTLVGFVIGVASGKDETIKFDGKSPEEVRAILAKLRSKARITDIP
jgi:ABC-type transport system involved in cytochrome bd biosynthesis fused ATPase/permease subunit